MNSVCIFMIAVVAGVYGATYDSTLTACSSDHLCTSKHDGTFQCKRSPRYFYTCVGNSNLGCQQCATSNLRYNEKCKQCLSKFEDKRDQCPATGAVGGADMCAPDGFCEDKKDGTYQDPYNNKKFLSCVHGSATECQTCPNNLIYVQVCGQCLGKYKDSPSVCFPSNPTNGIPVEKCPSAFCMHKADGDYEGDSHSGTYYACTEGTCLIRNCAANTVFSERCGRRCGYSYKDCKRHSHPRH